MTTTALECCLCSSVLDEPTAKLSPVICTALAYAPEMWDSPEAAKVAEGIKRALAKGRPTHRVVVGLLMDPEYREWLKHPVFNDGLPLSCVEHQVKELLEHYSRLRIMTMLGRAYSDAVDDPKRTRDIALGLKVELEGVL